MQSVKIVVWQEGDSWIGYLQEFPDFWTQGSSPEDLRDPLKDLRFWARMNCHRNAEVAENAVFRAVVSPATFPAVALETLSIPSRFAFGKRANGPAVCIAWGKCRRDTGIVVTNSLVGTYTVSLSTAISNLHEPPAPGGAGIRFAAGSPGTAVVSLKDAENQITSYGGNAVGRQKSAGGLVTTRTDLMKLLIV